MGFSFSLRNYLNINSEQFPISIIAELGYKTSGFIQGYGINASPIIMIGFGFHT